MSSYTHKDVPEEIQNRFPTLKGRVFEHVEVPQHVYESSQKRSQVMTQQPF